MALNKRTLISKVSKETVDEFDSIFDDEETPYIDWTDLLAKDENDAEYFNGEWIEPGTSEKKTSKEDPSAVFASVPLIYKYLIGEGEVTGLFIFETPELYFPYGVSRLVAKGKTNFSIMARFSKTDPKDIRFVDVFTQGMYDWFADRIAENGWHYDAGGDEEFNRAEPGSFLRQWVRYPKNKTTNRPMTDRDKQWYIGLLNTKDEKTQFTAPFIKGTKTKPLPWAKLANLPLHMYVTVQCATVYLGGRKVSPQFRAVSGVISRKPKRGGKVVNTKRANELATENPSLALGINSIIDSLVLEDDPNVQESASGFVSSVPPTLPEETLEETKIVPKVMPKGMEAFLNKTRGTAAPRGRGTGTGRAAARGTNVVSRRPPQTPAKETETIEEESYD